MTLQIGPTTWRSTLAGCRVIVEQRLDGTIGISYGPDLPGRYTQDGQPISELKHKPKLKRLKKLALQDVGAGFFVHKVTCSPPQHGDRHGKSHGSPVQTSVSFGMKFLTQTGQLVC